MNSPIAMTAEVVKRMIQDNQAEIKIEAELLLEKLLDFMIAGPKSYIEVSITMLPSDTFVMEELEKLVLSRKFEWSKNPDGRFYKLSIPDNVVAAVPTPDLEELEEAGPKPQSKPEAEKGTSPSVEANS